MGEVTEGLIAAAGGDPHAADQLLPLIYNELRRLAAAKIAQEKPGQTLQATALVHEAYLRLVDGGQEQPWHDRAHFFAAAAEAMRRILIERARHRTIEHGGGRKRIPLNESEIAAPVKPHEAIAVDEALKRFETINPLAAQLVKLRYFVGLNHRETADVLGISPRKATKLWTYARTWLLAEIESQ
jgi:RNA polymerase sigma factor (TIGR02999 family)